MKTHFGGLLNRRVTTAVLLGAATFLLPLQGGGKALDFREGMVGSQVRGEVPYTPPEVLKYVEPIYPSSMRSSATGGYARVLFIVDQDGYPFDFIIEEASQYEFGKAAERAARQWEFAPAELDGEPVPIRLRIVFQFELGRGAVVTVNPVEDVMNRIQRNFPRKPYRVSYLEELDFVPEPVRTVSPVYPRELKEQGIEGRVIVQFFIDPEGRVRAPLIRLATNQEFAQAVGMVIREWEFEPPVRNGRPVTARAEQPFIFDPRN